MARLADRLNAVRHASFVGRLPEKEIFADALSSSSPSFCVLYIFGAGGIGKSSLLRQMMTLCHEAKVRPLRIDAREIEPSPESFCGALAAQLELDEHQSPFDKIAATSTRFVLFIDTYELLTPLDGWLRETFLPQLPDNILVVLAGRDAPREGWKLDSAWQDLVRVLPLKNLSDDESALFLTQRGVPQGEQKRVLDFTHGHPLALSLVADVFAQHTPNQSQRPFDIASSPDIVRLLVEHLVQEVPSVRHRAALEACALVRCTTESLLAHLLDLPRDCEENAQLFRWLQSLSFIESGSLGLSPHDLAREAIMAYLRWRDAPTYATLHHRARSYYTAQLQDASPRTQQVVLADYIFLHHDNAVLRPFLEWQESSAMTATRATDEDFPTLLEIVRNHEGDDSARIAAHWFACQPERVLVLREGTHISGFVLLLALHQTTAEERVQDSVTQNIWNLLQKNAPLTQVSEEATVFRFWMSRDSYQDVSGAQSLIFINIVRHYLTNVNLAFSFLVCANPDFWSPVFTYVGATRFTELEWKDESRQFGVYGHDWRKVPPISWLDLLGEREIAVTSTPEASDVVDSCSTTNAEITHEDFALAVREALKNWSRPALLDSNALLRSQRVLDLACANSKDAAPDNVAILQRLLREACDNINCGGRSEFFHNALHLTYFAPSLTQEAAAEKMDVPFSTYRRYLKEGIARVTEDLWRREQAARKSDNGSALNRK